MIDVFIGTKAQYIKTAPLLRLMDAEDISYHLIDSGQHARFSVDLRRSLQLREPDVCLGSKDDITTVTQALAWLLKYLLQAIFRPGRLNGEVFSRDSMVCVIHGDTPSTLLSLIMAKRAGKKVAHLESGLRSFCWYRPFPEELIRNICARYCDLQFAPSAWAANNLKNMGSRGEIINIGQNTNVEALYYSLGLAAPVPRETGSYCVVTIHRVETILSKTRLRFVIELVREASQVQHVIFVMHPPTTRKLADFGLLPQLEEIENLSMRPLQKHQDFLQLLAGARFVVTDGGSIQEETCYLDVPCLVLRRETERQEGIGGNAVLGNFELAEVRSFLNTYQSHRCGQRTVNMHPSRKILERLTAP